MPEVVDWLKTLGMSEYAERFAESDIDFAILTDLTDQDLEKIGVASLGHRRKLLRAIANLEGIEKSGPVAAIAAARPATPRPADTAERRQVTVMFSDLVGSTALSARMDPEDLREIISSYQKCVAETVGRFGGFVAKYMGDGVLVYFGYPQAHEDDTEQAVRAGLGLIQAVCGLKSTVPLQIRVGIATGLVVVGDLVGSGEAQERGIVGETPNLAARLQGIAEPNTVVIAESTRKLLGNLFELEEIEAQDVKGIAGPVRAWAALRPISMESRFEALHASGLTELVGREEELDLLLRRWRKAKTGEGQVVLLSGEPGIGKSRLTAALAERFASEPHARLRYFCSPQHTDSALYPILSQMERTAGFAHSDATPTKLDRLDALLVQSFTPREDAALFAEMLSLPNDGRYHPLELTPQQRRRKTLEALTARLEALSRTTPVLMVFEDVQWIDPTSLDALARAIERIKALCVLLIVTYRSEFEPPWIGRPYVTALTLNRLGDNETDALINRVTGNKALPESIRQDIIERTDGIPLFVEEMTRAVLEAENEGEARKSAAAIPSSLVPASLHASLMARLDRLGSAKQAAQIGAAIGREFSHPLLAAVTQKSEAELQSALDRLIKAGLLFRQGTPPDAMYLFKHALVQDAAYSSLLRGQRQELHRQIATALEDKFPEITAAQPGLLAQHYAQAGLNEPALKFWTIAGDLAERRAMSGEAVAHYRAARAVLSSPALSDDTRASEPRLLMKLGSALQQIEGYNSASALDAYQDARAAALKLDQLEEHANASIGMGPCLFAACRYQEALEIGDEISAHSFDRLGPHNRVRLLTMRGVANFGLGEYKSAWQQTTAAFALDDETPCTHENPLGGGDPAIVARRYAIQSGLPLGYVDECLPIVSEALEIARKRNHAFTVAWALLNAAHLYRETGRFADALSNGSEAIALCERYGFVARIGTVLLYIGAAYCRLGDTERGLGDIRRGLDIWRSTSNQFHMSYHLSDFADCLLRAKKYDEADRALREAEQIIAETDERSHVGEVLRLRGLLQILSGDVGDGAAKLWQAVKWARSRDARLFELRALRDLTLSDISQDEKKKAATALHQLLSWFPHGLEIPDLHEARDALQPVRPT